MALDESKNTEDNVYNFEKLKVIINDKTINMIGSNMPLTIDFIKDAYQEGFTIDNGANC